MEARLGGEIGGTSGDFHVKCMPYDVFGLVHKGFDDDEQAASPQVYEAAVSRRSPSVLDNR